MDNCGICGSALTRYQGFDQREAEVFCERCELAPVTDFSSMELAPGTDFSSMEPRYGVPNNGVFLAIYSGDPICNVSLTGTRERINFSPSCMGSTRNINTVEFGITGRMTVTHFAIFDHKFHGGMLFSGALTVPLNPEDGDTVRLAPGAIKLELT